MNINNKIFVYGTLLHELPGSAFTALQLHIKNIVDGKINARMFDLGIYPGIIPTTNKLKFVTGKIYAIDTEHFADVLAILDEYELFDSDEEEGSLFVRRVTPVVCPNGRLSGAWTYWYNKPVIGKREIESGDYTRYLSENSLRDALK